MKKTIGILGAGNSGLALAGHLAFVGHDVVLWNRTNSDSLRAVSVAGDICLGGEIECQAKIPLATTVLEQVMERSALLIITTPASAHRDIAAAMAPYINDGHTILLSPGRTFGALEFKRTFNSLGVAEGYCLGEAQSVIHASRVQHGNFVTIYGIKHDVPIAPLAAEQTDVLLASLPDCLKPIYRLVRSTLDTGFGNVGMILHCAPVLMNAGWIESRHTEFLYYYDAITPSVARLLEKLDAERQKVAGAVGARTASLCEWLGEVYGVTGDSLYECIQANDRYAKISAPRSLNHRYLFEDVPTGLVPIEAVGQMFGIPTPLTSLIIGLAEAALETDFRGSGRNIQNLGLTKELVGEL